MLTLPLSECPTCSSADIRRLCRDWIGHYRGRTYRVPKLEYYECPRCGERVYDREAMRKIEARSPAFAQPVTPRSRRS